MKENRNFISDKRITPDFGKHSKISREQEIELRAGKLPAYGQRIFVRMKEELQEKADKFRAEMAAEHDAKVQGEYQDILDKRRSERHFKLLPKFLRQHSSDHDLDHHARIEAENRVSAQEQDRLERAEENTLTRLEELVGDLEKDSRELGIKDPFNEQVRETENDRDDPELER